MNTLKPKILLVENDQAILQLMEILLKNMGYEPVLVENGIDALQLVRREPPAMILLDIMMTPISGWEFLERLRSEPAHKEIPVILFTASTTVMERMAQMNDPRLGILHKPVTPSELKRSIEQYLL
ncbi:MAG: response regulator [Methanoregula sp.]|nr:response regulator [Methanoregula sp.]